MALAGKDESATVVRERALRVEQSQLFDVRIDGALYEPLDSLAGAGVGQPQIDEDLAALLASVGEEGKPVIATFAEDVPNGARLK